MFIFILIVTTLSIAGSAAFFSIYGLAHIFSSAFMAVVVMGSVLEAGKLVAASFLYRYWDRVGFMMKTYLMSAIAVLMLITSLGIYGYLSAAYQTDSVPLKEIEQTVQLLEREKSELMVREKEINADVNRIGANYVKARERLIAKYAPEKDDIVIRRQEITAEILALSKRKINQEAHTGPIIYIAEQMGKPVNDAISYMIFLIIFVFDPLAVMLTIGGNIALDRRKDGKDKTTETPPKEIIVEKEVPVEVEKVVEKIVEVEKEVEKVVEDTTKIDELTRLLQDEQIGRRVAEQKLSKITELPDQETSESEKMDQVVIPTTLPIRDGNFSDEDKGIVYKQVVAAAKQQSS